MRHFFKVGGRMSDRLDLAAPAQARALGGPADQADPPGVRILDRETEGPGLALAGGDAAGEVVVVAGVEVDPQLAAGIVFVEGDHLGLAGEVDGLAGLDDGGCQLTYLGRIQLGIYAVAVDDSYNFV